MNDNLNLNKIQTENCLVKVIRNAKSQLEFFKKYYDQLIYICNIKSGYYYALTDVIFKKIIIKIIKIKIALLKW